MQTCPYCRATVARLAELKPVAWQSVTFECGTWDYYRDGEALKCGKRSEKCRVATNTPDEPSRHGERPVFNRKRYPTQAEAAFNGGMIDEEGIDRS